MNQENRRPRVLICDPIAGVGVQMLEEVAAVDIKKGLTPDALQAVIPDYEAVVVRSATKITTGVIEKGTRLRVIGRAGAGLDNIDVAAAEQRGIKVVNAPEANTLAVAELAMGLMLALARHLPQADATMKQGEWAKSRLKGIGLSGKTLGLVGFGRIGKAVAARAQSFGMTVLVTRRHPRPEEDTRLGVETVELNTLLRRADFVSLHVPARPETQNLIGAEQLALMKPGAYLINTARGTVVDEDALLLALDEGRLAGAALDVYRQEPVVDSPLARHERVIATPHIGASTVDAQDAAAITVAGQIVDVLKQGKA